MHSIFDNRDVKQDVVTIGLYGYDMTVKIMTIQVKNMTFKVIR